MFTIRRSIILLLIFNFSFTVSYAQLMKWLVRTVSYQVRLVDFSGPSPTISTPSLGYGIGGEEDVNVMTDVNGHVLFTSAVSGSLIEIRDSNYVVMPNGAGLLCDPSTLESGIVRIPCSSNKFYFIHFNLASRNLYYSIVDMSLNSGLGDVTNKNTLLGVGYSEGIAISHQTRKGCRWLLVAHINGNTYEITRFLINDAGISSPTIIASYTLSGGISSPPHDIDFTPDNSKLIMSTWTVNTNDSDIVAWDFDLENGTVSNQQSYSVSNEKILGISPSPNGQLVYFIDNASSGGVKCGRLNLITQAVEVITNSIGQYSANIAIAGNGKIYFMQSYTNGYLSEIDNPDSPTLAGIGFTPNKLLINSTGCRPAIPNCIDGEPPGTTTTPQYIEFSTLPTSICGEFQFIDSTCLATWWEWDFGDGFFSSQQNPIHLYTSSGIYSVTHRVVACGDTLTLTKNNYITVASSTAVAQFATQDSLCLSDTSSFTNSSTGAVTNLWNFGDGDTSTSSASILTHIYQNPGNYPVRLIVSGNCGNDTADFTVTINPRPSASIGANGPTSFCAGDSVTLTCSNPGNIVSYQWNTSQATSSIVVTTSGTYTVVVTDTNGCSANSSNSITVASYTPPTILISSNVTICTGDSTTLTVSGGYSYSWSPTIGLSATSGNSVKAAPAVNTTYTVIGTDTNGCNDTVTVNVVVSATQSPNVAFALADSNICTHDSIITNNNSTNSSTFLWRFGDGDSSLSVNAVHSYNIPGSYLVTLIAFNNCGTDSSSIYVFVADTPAVSFLDSVIDCGMTVHFMNTGSNFSSVFWNFGDGGSDSIHFNPVYAFFSAGTYTVTLTLKNSTGCLARVSQDVTVSNNAEAHFTFLQLPCESRIQFMDSSAYAQIHQWSFGDGTYSSVVNPEHGFTGTGNYTITLSINPGTPCVDSISEVLFVESNELNSIFIPNAFTPNFDSLNETFKILGNFSCDGYHLEVFNRWGEKLFESFNPENIWDGTYKNEPVPDGVYVFLFHSGRFEKRGMITILR